MEKFALSEKEYNKQRNWKVSYMNSQDTEFKASIKEMLVIMQSQYRFNADLAVCKTKRCNIYIDGDTGCTTVSLTFKEEKPEYMLGYNVIPLKYYKNITQEQKETREYTLNLPLLKDFFSSMILDKNFVIE